MPTKPKGDSGRAKKNEPVTCKPLDDYNEIMKFLENPPPWRTLCKEITPHSNFVIRNIECNKYYEPSLEKPENYCHFDPDVEAPTRYDITEKKLPKTLVCHDMANGYHSDSVIEGTLKYDEYTFYNWAGIDIFCYFSHHLITIPPAGWINVGHAHGVKVIGTIISEWTDGASFWDKVLASRGDYENFANAVVNIAKTLKFDGWLLNIENKILKPDELLQFVEYLHKTMHAEMTDPVLIWYDSVTVNGSLNWQNGLNEKNKAFFDVCDGFFTNYSWSVEDVDTSVKFAGDRVTDLFIGIDVWGRNIFGGGQFNIQEAIKVAHAKGCSLAIFAPAWTHEAMSDDPKDPNFISMAEDLNKVEKFMLRDRALWGSVWPFLNTRLPCHLPFQTSFCRGLGKKRRLYGEVIAPCPWYNLRHQQYQPNAAHGPHGYMLSTHEKIMHVSRTSMQRDKMGIIRYRDSFQMSRQQLQSVMSEPRDTSAHSDIEKNSSELLEELAKRRDNSLLSVKVDSSITDLTGDFKVEEIKSDELTEKHTQVDPTTGLQQEVSTQTQEKNQKCVRKFIDKLKDICKKRKLDEGEIARDNPGDDVKIASTSTPGALAQTPDQSPSTSPGHSAMHSPNRSAKHSPEHSPAHSPDQASADCPHENEPQRVRIEEDLSHSDSDTPRAHRIGQSLVTMSISLNLKQPKTKTRWALAHLPKERECLQLYLDDSYNGGACLRVNPSDSLCAEHRTTRLFHCDFQCLDTLIFCVVTKTTIQASDQSLDLRLSMTNARGEDLLVVLLGRTVEMSALLNSDSSGIKYVSPVYSELQKEFHELRRYLLVNQPGFYVPIDNLDGWDVRYYVVHVPKSRLTAVNCRTALPSGGILFGHFGICHRDTSEEST
ncbi:cytosolic endo-beta-N-acetylglucosaminidase [Anticarsia gemmatalis]|uniref:cytosolic endo-beta-N-acetylglucosaminidase n=1 Tax=Anticarsia gemmatalis TaxID=129554 RepID=UPI003F76E7D8